MLQFSVNFGPLPGGNPAWDAWVTTVGPHLVFGHFRGTLMVVLRFL
jgi:hypothetical protein